MNISNYISVPQSVVNSIITFLNYAKQPTDIKFYVRDDPNKGYWDQESDYGIGEKVAANIIEKRNSLPDNKFKSLDDLEGIKGLSDEKMDDLIFTFTETIFFAEKDLELLNKAVSIFPVLEKVVYACSVAKERLSFPLHSADDLAPLTADDLHPKIKSYQIGMRQVKKFVPPALYPIETVEELFEKLLACITWGDTLHFNEKLQWIARSSEKLPETYTDFLKKLNKYK